MSAAIPIVRPPAGALPGKEQDGSSRSSAPSQQQQQQPDDDNNGSKKLCRNVMIYGHCKYEKKGCLYAHPSSSSSNADTAQPSQGAIPTSKPLSAVQANAPAFIPSSSQNASPQAASAVLPQQRQPTPLSAAVMAAKAPEFIPREHTPALSEDAAFYGPPSTSTQQQYPQTVDQRQPDARADEMAHYYGQMNLSNDYSGGEEMYDYSQSMSHHGPQDYYAQSSFHAPPPPRLALQYHHYHPPPSSVPSTSFFLPPSLHVQLTQQSEAIQAVSTVDLKLPEEVAGYRGLVLQTAAGPGGGEWAGWKTRVYKAWKEGRPWALRRIEGFRPQHEQSIVVVDKWTRVRHSGIVGVREAFTTRDFGDSSLIVVTDFHPLSTSIHDLHFSPLPSLPANPWLPPQHSFAAQQQVHPNAGAGGRFRAGPGGSSFGHGVPERVVWAYVVQLVAAVSLVHARGMAVRNLEPGRILVTGKNRVRISGHAVNDVLLGFDQNAVPAYQQEDLLSLGKLICALASGSLGAYANLAVAVDHLTRSYSADLKNVVLYLLSKPSSRKTIDEVSVMISRHTLDVMEEAFATNDAMEGYLMRELENARLVRLMTKLGFINERPEFDHDARWAETGDRYIIKLFRDYVFHQVDENGRPVTDLSHVLTCLNKLDAGVDEKVMLVSRDEQSCLIVSYREIKNCIEAAFLDLSRSQ